MDAAGDALQSSQSFVRALKSAVDPPYKEGLSKIQIARLGWESQALYVPRKSDLILEWILTRFYKEKATPNYILDLAHWSLLADILVNPGDAHIIPIISRISIPALVSSLMTLYPSVPISSRAPLLSNVLRSLNVLWPLAVQRAGLDPLSECLWSSLTVINQLTIESEDDGLAEIITFVITACRSAFDNANTAGKKKVYLTFSQHQFQPWLHVVYLLPPTQPLCTQLYCLGTDILLNADSLRGSLDISPNPNTNVDIFSILFGSSTSSSPETCTALLPLLPRLYNSYVAALRRHRSLISSGAQAGQQSRERLRLAAMRFGCACLIFLKKMEAIPELLDIIWGTKVDVLRVMEEEALFDNMEENEVTNRVRELGTDALNILNQAWNDPQSFLVMQALDALSCLHRIEPDLVGPFIPQILERLATCSPVASQHSFTFLSQLTSYHSKTRTLHTLISRLLSALSSSFSFLPSLDAQTVYGLSMRSPLLSLPFTDELSDAIRAFMTPGQEDEAVKAVNEALDSTRPTRETFNQLSRKRRKLMVSYDEGMHHHDRNEDNGPNTLKFPLVARLSAVALGAIFQRGRNTDTTKKACLERVDSFLSEVMKAAFEFGSGSDEKKPKIREGKPVRHKKDEYLQWDRQCLCAALLRLWYDLFAGEAFRMEPKRGDFWRVAEVLEHLHGGFLSLMYDGDVLPELQLEIVRVLYSYGGWSSQKNGGQDARGWLVLDAVLDYVEAELFNREKGLADSDPGGQVTSDTRRCIAISLWSLTLERYLFAIDAYASNSQLSRLADLMLHVQPDHCSPPDKKQPSIESILTRTLASASFWELGNIRASMLAMLEKWTDGFARIETSRWLAAVIGEDSEAKKTLSKASKISWDDIQSDVKIYHVLHYFPPEYLSRTSRLELAKRALAADVLVQALGGQKECNQRGVIECRAVLRSFVASLSRQAQTKTIDEITSVRQWMSYLTMSKYDPPRPTKIYTDATLNLLSLAYLSATRAAVNAEGILLSNILSHFMQSRPFLGINLKNERLAQSSLLRFLGMLVRDFKPASFSEGILQLLQRLCDDLTVSLRPAIGATASQIPTIDFLASGHVIEAWRILISLKRWLSIEVDLPNFGEMLLAKTAFIIGNESTEKAAISEEFCSSILSLLIEQAQSSPVADSRPMETIAAAYILFTKPARKGVPVFDTHMTQASKMFSAAQFERILELVAEALESGDDSEAELVSLMHLSTLLLREAPERTSKLSHEHMARCIRTFVNRTAFTKGTSSLASQVLDFIHCQCVERPALLKTFDVACIWSILSRLLTCCPEHDQDTSASLFQGMVSIINALVRLRRDLLSPHLPQLAMVLRQLMMVLRGVRPMLGIKQHRLVSDKLPRWISPDQPLGEAEARALARLLTALTTKSVVRSHASNDTQKAESLARPFARHAPYVLLAYLRLMNDPLNVLSITMRRELEPGLFALCNMMGEHGRDTLMVQSLDVGGKALLRSLWKEYDKQRYIGGG